jgi:hypothetical protein
VHGGEPAAGAAVSVVNDWLPPIFFTRLQTFIGEVAKFLGTHLLITLVVAVFAAVGWWARKRRKP